MNFKVGDYFIVKPGASLLNSSTARLNPGQMGKIIKIGMANEVFYFYSDLPNCLGIWITEVEPIGIREDDYEDI